MIAYIAVAHYHYDSTEQINAEGEIGGPSVIYLDYEEAATVARTFDSSGVSGGVWEVELP